MELSRNVRRKLFIHSAHDSVGVLGQGPGLRPYCRAGLSPCESLDVTLGACISDRPATAAMDLFTEAVRPWLNLWCQRVLLEDAEVGFENGSDCVVLFHHGLHIARRWSDFDPMVLSDRPKADAAERLEVVATQDAAWRPVLDGVGSFSTRCHTAEDRRLVDGAVPLLVGRAGDQVWPVAWARAHGPRSGVFSTSLGFPEHFNQPEFVRLVVNVLRWLTAYPTT